MLVHDKDRQEGVDIIFINKNKSPKFYFVKTVALPFIPIIKFRTDAWNKGRIKICWIVYHFKN